MINVTNGDREYTFFLSNTNPDLPLEDRHIDIELGGHLEGGFCGTVRAAREAGFTVEEIEVGEPIPERTVEVQVEGPEIVALKERIEGLEKDLAEAKEALVGTQELLVDARQEMVQFKEAVVGMFRERITAGDISRDTANEWLERLGAWVDPIKGLWTVRVTDDNTGYAVLTVTGVEADEKDEAEEEVKDNLLVDATIVKVTFSLDYEGEGEADFDEQYPVWEGLEDENWDYEFAFINRLSFDATEE